MFFTSSSFSPTFSSPTSISSFVFSSFFKPSELVLSFSSPLPPPSSSSSFRSFEGERGGDDGLLEVTSFKDIVHQLLKRIMKALRVFSILVKLKLFDLLFDAFEAAASQLLQSFAADICNFSFVGDSLYGCQFILLSNASI